MGRITVFTTEKDLNSFRLMQALEKRGLPYTEISLYHHPSKLSDVKKLAAGTEALPQCFFNTRRVGGLTETLKELRKWDKNTKYENPKAKFDAEIAAFLDPIDQRLAVPDDLVKAGYAEMSGAASLPVLEKTVASVSLPDGTYTTVSNLTDKIRNTIPLKNLLYKGTMYKNSFTGETVVQTFQESLQLEEEAAIGFAQQLLNSKIMHHVTDKSGFKNSKKELYRLQCHMNADVLNSMSIWTANVTTDGNQLLDQLDKMLIKVETKSTFGALHKMDFKEAALIPDFLAFEEAICELQQFDMTTLKFEDEKKAFALNLYSLMLRFAFIKIGISQTEAQHLKFLSGTKFNVGGLIFSFQDWIDGVLRGNNKSTSNPKVPFNLVDRRRKFALTKLDYRIHFALNIGSKVGSAYSSPFPHFSSENIDEELSMAGRVLCTDDANIKIDVNARQISLSKIFGWYKSDFATDDTKLLTILETYLGGVKKAELHRIQNSGVKSMQYIDIDWARSAGNCDLFETEKLVSNIKGFKALARRFVPPKTPFNEKARVDTLKSLNILDTLPEERFDRISKEIGDELDFPVVLIALMDQERNWFKSALFNCQLPMPEAPSDGERSISFCGHTILGASNQVFCVENLLEDDRFADNPYVIGLGVRFYAGCPITVPSQEDGSPVNIGTVCVFGFEPRRFIEEDRKALQKYAAKVKREIMRKDSMSMSSSKLTNASVIKNSAVNKFASAASTASTDLSSDTGSNDEPTEKAANEQVAC